LGITAGLSLCFRVFRLDCERQKRQNFLENPAKLICNPHKPKPLHPKTWSPFLNRFTSLPTASISPACPRIMDPGLQTDSRARFFHCSTFTPLINSHKGNNSSAQDVSAGSRARFASRLGQRNPAKLCIRKPKHSMINKTPINLGKRPDLNTSNP